MISVRHRFHGHNSLRVVYSRGQTVRAPFITLKYLERREGRPYRAAVVVSRKVHKSAVVRNRIRRRLYEIIRRADSRLTARRDLVFTVFSEQVAEMPAAQLTATVENLLQKAAAKPSGGPQTPVSRAGHAIVNKRRVTEDGQRKK
ncbi:MAG TPA: ribonuclease P protein component [Candidatus Saccharimonadales bacterium]|nr:ribonuclease P protein component [Candidatus Saccharimonadales bacterium]